MKNPPPKADQRRGLGSGPARRGQVVSSAKKAIENPFDKFANTRKKHEVLNRKVKGEDRDVGRARAKAIDERKTKLLSDINRNKKSNTVLDKRFGESDPTISLEERMFMRFQKERVKGSRNSSAFNLDATDTEVLTHKGQLLGQSNLDDHDWVSSDDEDRNGGLDRAVVESLHFGGGFREKASASEVIPHKGRLDALQEIVMKSKLHKLEKKEAKEEQEEERTKIDNLYEELFTNSMLNFNNKKSVETGNKELDDYDVALKEMNYEARLPAAERTKSAEEVALEEQKRIEELEVARIRRMKGQDVKGQDKEVKDEKRKKRTDDEIDDDAFERPAKKGGKKEEKDDDEEDEEAEDDDADDDDAEEDDEEVEVDGEEEQVEASDEDAEADDSAEDEGEAEVNIEMPHKIDCPQDLDAFDELIELFVVNFDVDFPALVQRILAWNNVRLPGEAGAENRNSMHNFLDVLLKHFVRVGDSLCTSDAKMQLKVVEQLDFLSAAIFKVSQDVGEGACGALWTRTVKILQAQVQKRLRDYSLGQRDSSCWPSLGRLLLLQLLGRVFSVTDLKNDVVGPALFLLCQYLSQCPVSSTADLCSGLLVSSMILSTFSGETRRYVPEVTAFVHSLLSMYLPGARKTSDFQSTFNVSSLQWLREGVHDSRGQSGILWSYFHSKKSSSSAAILSTAFDLVREIFKVYSSQTALPEIMGPILTTLSTMCPRESPAFPKALQKAHVELLEKSLGQAEEVRESRQSLQWRKDVTVSIETKAPRFTLDYTFKKDKDEDAEKAKMKQLTRQLKREKKAAMRELRRDSDFIDQERYKEETVAADVRRAERVKNFGWMEEQQATINQQVRKGGSLMKGGGS
ncbi:nucleolar protein 14, partial [Ochromonadaceae sp. CCMP2298]